MNPAQPAQLISYIAPGAPATRRHAVGGEPFLRPEIGFAPAWYRQHLDINFGERFHTDPAYRRDCAVKMRAELKRRFPGTAIGGIDRPEAPLDPLTGAYGAGTVAAIYGVPLVYAENNWPNCAWNATPYLGSYAQAPGVGYIDMGLESNLARARELFPPGSPRADGHPHGGRQQIPRRDRGDFRRLAREYAPCDVVVADIDSGVPDRRIHELVELCAGISDEYAALPLPL